jgi:hypothetical protein
MAKVKMRQVNIILFTDLKQEYDASDGEKVLKALQQLIDNTREHEDNMAAFLLGLENANIVEVEGKEPPTEQEVAERLR